VNKICERCSAIARVNAPCLECGHVNVIGEARRLRRRRSSGRNTQAWTRLVAAAIARDGCCVVCGSTEDLTGDHIRTPARSLADVRVLCRKHNSADGGRRSSRHVGGVGNAHARGNESPRSLFAVCTGFGVLR